MELVLFGYSFIIEKKKQEPIQEEVVTTFEKGQTGVWRDKEMRLLENSQE